MKLDNEQRIIGNWLTPKQAIYFGVAAIAIIASFQYLGSRFGALVTVLVLVGLWRLWPSLMRPKITKEYLQRKRSRMTEKSFERWRQKMIASVEGHIGRRKGRGLPPGPDNIRERELLEDFGSGNMED